MNSLLELTSEIRKKNTSKAVDGILYAIISYHKSHELLHACKNVSDLNL